MHRHGPRRSRHRHRNARLEDLHRHRDRRGRQLAHDLRHIHRRQRDQADEITITTPADGAQIARGATVTPDFACSDEDGGSGIESCDAGTIDTSTPGEKTFEVTAVDKAGNTRTATSTYTVVNSAPAVRLTDAPAEVDEGGTATYAYEATDPNGDTLEITESCGDATRIDTAQADSFACRFGDGPGSARVSVTADDGPADGSDAADVAIRNVAPTADAGGPYSGPWDDAIAFDGSDSDDAGDDQLAYAWDFDYDGSFDPTAVGAAPSHAYESRNERTVALRVTDDDGATSELATATVAVGDRAATLAYTGAATAQYSDAAALSATLTDAGSGARCPGARSPSRSARRPPWRSPAATAWPRRVSCSRRAPEARASPRR